VNCLDFRRLMETSPGDAGAQARAHASVCPACADLERRVALLDRSLRNAVRVPVPENLEARILMRQSFHARRRPRRWRRAWPALAAGVLLLIGLALHAGRIVHRETGLHGELVALVEAADYALQARGPVRKELLDAALRPVGLTLREPVGEVSFAGRCLVRGKLSGHLVLRDASTPVSVFLMPEERVSRESSFERKGWRGVLVPTAAGTVGIVVPGGAPPDETLVDRVVRAVHWPA